MSSIISKIFSDDREYNSCTPREKLLKMIKETQGK